MYPLLPRSARILLGSLVASLALVAVPSAASAATPGTPTGLSTVSRGADSWRVSWKAVSGAASYRLYWGTKADGTGRTRLNTSGTSTTITGMTPGVTYYVKIAARSASGASSAYTKDLVSAAPMTVPTGLTTRSRSAGAWEVSWASVPGAASYRLYWGTKADGTGRTRLNTSGTSTTIPVTSTSQTYYVRIAARSAAGASSAYSADLVSSSSAPPVPAAPTGLTLGTPAASSVPVSWSAVSGATGYTVRKASDSATTTTPVSGTSTTLAGLAPSTTYTISVAASNGAGPSAYSATKSVTTAAAPSSGADIDVASYNVFANKTAPSAHAWGPRRDAVVAMIESRHPDVIGLQEASQNPLPGTATKDLKFYYTDIINGLRGYALTNTAAYNCQHAYSPMQWGGSGRCAGDQIVDQGASAGTRIAYDTTKLTLLTSGSKLLGPASDVSSSTTTGKSYNERYLTWATFRNNATGTRFFFGDTHLDVTSASNRVTQAGIIQQTIPGLAGNLPVVLVGDFNSYRYNNQFAPIESMTAAGYVDPLGQQYNTAAPGPGAQAGLERLPFTNCDSQTEFRTRLPLSTAPISGQKDCWNSSYNQYNQYNGNNIDYIFTKGGAVAKQWETVLKLDSSGNMLNPDGSRVTATASDHNMIRAVVRLPGS